MPKNKQIIILGNGPSLRGFDLKRISRAGYHSFGMNSAYRHWRDIGWYPTYFACFDFAVTRSHKEEFRKLVFDKNIPTKKFFFRSKLWDHPKVVGVPNPEAREITTGTGVCRMAIKMGYKKLLLMGIDCNYVEKIPESEGAGGRTLKIKETPERNPNYFFDNYQQKGDIYHIPSGKGVHMKAWEWLHKDMKKLGVDIVNCSPRSKVRFFRFGKIDNVL